MMMYGETFHGRHTVQATFWGVNELHNAQMYQQSMCMLLLKQYTELQWLEHLWDHEN